MFKEMKQAATMCSGRPAAPLSLADFASAGGAVPSLLNQNHIGQQAKSAYSQNQLPFFFNRPIAVSFQTR